MAGVGEQEAARDLSWLQDLKTLGDRFLSDVQALEREQGELDILIRQTHSEIERVSPQEAAAQRRLREVEANLQAFGPAELRSAYASARELELKLFVLRTQLESLGRKKEELVARQRVLGELHTLLARATYEAEKALAAGEGLGLRALPLDSLAHFEQQMAYLSQVLLEGPAQSLVNASIAMEIIRRLASSSPEKLGEELDRLSHTIEQTLNQIKYAVYTAGPPALAELGLEGSLRRLAKLLASYGGVRLELAIEGPERHWPVEWAASVYRLITGLLLLPLRHRSPEAKVSLRFSGSNLEVDFSAPVGNLDGPDGELLAALAGLSEAAGGSLSHGPSGDGTHSVRLSLPLPAGL